MKNINFTRHVLPHLIAMVVFILVTLVFFNPFFFGNKTLDQQDINQWKGGAQATIEYREATGEEALWTNSMFSGMPAYLIDVHWSDGIVTNLKIIMAIGFPHPVRNILLSFISFYILLLSFKVRPYLAIAGALAFGLSTYMIIGFGAGHNSRIGSIAFMPLVLAGIHTTLKRNTWLGFGLTATALALHLRENHLQITYYLLLMVGIYGVLQLFEAIMKKEAAPFLKKVGLLVAAGVLALGTFFGEFWATYEYSQYSRVKSELRDDVTADDRGGLTKEYAFQYSNDAFGPFTLLIPNFLGGDYSNFLIQDENSEVYRALSRSNDAQTANQLARYTSAYWGDKPPAPYYAGAIVCFFFVLGAFLVERKYVIWLVSSALIGIILAYGDTLSSVNYFLFDYLPGYNKFRSVTFALVITHISLPLLAFMGVEKILSQPFDKALRKKLFIALASVGGLCLLVWLFAGLASFTKEGEDSAPRWFLNALISDRKAIMRGDALRSLGFILAATIVLYFMLIKKIKAALGSLILAFIIFIDLSLVDRRFFGDDNYKRKSDRTFFNASEADQAILADDSDYRVYNLQGSWAEAKTSYHHSSIGGYHGAKMRRYQDLIDNCIQSQTSEMITNLQSGNSDLSPYTSLNMLNVKYIKYGEERGAVIPNNDAFGSAWLVEEIVTTTTANDEIEATCSISGRGQAVVNTSQFEISNTSFATEGSIKLKEKTLNKLTYEVNLSAKGFAVFSEIYYPIGWSLEADGKAVELIRANYILRAAELPAGNYTLTMTFKPDAYYVGDTITLISQVVLLLVFLGSIGWSIYNFQPAEEA